MTGRSITGNTPRSNGDLLLEAINWLLDKGFPFDRVNDNAPFNVAKYNGANTRKVYADVYIDDHNVGGLPPWEEIYRLIAAMKVVSC